MASSTESSNWVTKSERVKGWVEFNCPAHGFLVAANVRASVSCRCGKKAVPHVRGRVASTAQLRSARKRVN